MRENPKKSIRLVDPEFSFAIYVSGSGGFVINSSRQREQDQHPPPPCVSESKAVSSIFDTTPEEDVAYCLIMMSRDKWMRDEEQELKPKYEDNDDETEESDEIELCHKVFRSYQVLGRHRASHKNARAHNNGVSNQTHEEAFEVVENRNVGVSEEKNP
ncbi:Zinc finger protein ZAT9 [Camellia lanceoleosa]|uniref:Zinc finger protein ZAT9 n=1 Tax=Camellia lanceoleosa TaxID=1840588 RepID=A0ACC0G518_9ERIC|nr:Zinc finger protein ZAT9 [Camellia lanceoleosa]